MAAQSLGYLGVRAKDLGDWGTYGSTMLGLQRIDKSARTMAFRMDDRQQRIIVDADGGEGLPGPSMPLRRGSRRPGSRWRAAPVRSPMSDGSRI
jgi:hypothetical protein